ncbi:hypothetical protein DL89DRAFT_315550 [Linderina pennispora]|uniref:G-protein coupled receptors family 1 profile domain-containing protein n=1 Tax=Linderina pennispora TaxID=61395 RepID=A0A1Y1WBG0_9FUNG|nr:uncharacterized protein DL89DRAFT_315544 [Linderina pennispora]XP_040744450.1 uncharacterized protein DL89DRAFT_315550 [Linderina pennispora]ORX70866.1 hypothetical protein DL89DRAFT_315544 [Linderina pennispora]ORX70871.1 hypothetical protein DL89DRAFT_315550 [Linderina pennispora]
MSDNWDRYYSPTSVAEMPVFYTALAVSLTNIPIIGYAIYNRDYLPIKSKNVWIVAGIGLGSTIFNVSFNILNGMMGFEGVLGYCRFWTAWMMSTLGLGLFLSPMNMRLIIYYRVFVTRRTHSYTHFTVAKFLRRYWPLFVLWMPVVASSIVASVLPAHKTVQLVVDHGLNTCHNNFSFLYFIFAYFAAQVLVAWGLYLRMRKIAKAFNEFRLALWTLLIFTAIFVLNLAVMLAQGTVYPWGRIFLAFANMVLFNSYFWTILGPPIYGHIFRREATLRRFMDDMHEDGILAQQAHIGSAHKHLYGVEDGTNSYVKQSDLGTSAHAPYSQMPTAVNPMESSTGTDQYSPYMQRLASTSTTSISTVDAAAQSRGRLIL